MKKLITIMTMFSITATPVLSVVSCNEREAPNMGNFYYLDLKEINNDNAQQKMEEVFILLNDAEKGSGEGGIGYISAIMNLWKMYALIINDHFAEYLNFDELEKKFKDYKFWGDFISAFNRWDSFLEYYDFWVENNGLPYGWIYAQEIKKDYDSVFGVSS